MLDKTKMTTSNINSKTAKPWVWRFYYTEIHLPGRWLRFSQNQPSSNPKNSFASTLMMARLRSSSIALKR